MKLVLAVLALAAVAAAGVVVEHPVEHLVEHSAVQPTEQPAGKSTMPVKAPLVKLDSDAKMITLYSGPSAPESLRAHEIGGMKKVLNGPVMVAFKDAVKDKMNVFLLPYGFKFLNIYDPEEVRPLVNFLNNGRQKSFMYLSAASHLQLPEMLKKLDQIYLPAYNLNTAIRIAKHSSPYPYILIVDTESIRGNGRVADLKELGVFKMENGVLAVVRDNYPIPTDLKVDHAESRSFGIVLPVHSEVDPIGEYVKSLFADKDLVREYVKPVFADKDLVREYVKPVYAETDLVREYVKPVLADKELVREYVKPVYAEKDLVTEYVKPVYADKDLVREYVKPVYAAKDLVREYVKPVYAEKDLVTEYVKPFYSEKDLAREYLGSVYAGAEKDLIHEYFNPIYTERHLVHEYL